MSAVDPERRGLSDGLDALCASGLRVARSRATKRALPRAIELALYTSLALPVALGLGRLFRLAGGPDARALALWQVLLAMALGAVVLVLGRLWAARQQTPERAELLGQYDRASNADGRLLAADDFLRVDATGPFVLAALDDANDALARAQSVRLSDDVEAKAPGVRSYIALALALVLAVWFSSPLTPVDEEVALGGVPQDLEALDVPEREPVEDVAAVEDPPIPEMRPETNERDSKRGERADSASAVAPVSDEVKDSKGRTKSGQSSAASSASGASASRGTPSNQTQESRETEQKAKPGKKTKKEVEEPEPDDTKKEEGASGATAGRGSGSGSTKNPSTTDWSSKDHVESQEEEDEGEDADVEDEDSDSDARGGVQPSLRDRRPPVNRDLQIGFGAGRPNPDANGRGGPSPQKKSRGVASLVLGVPIPDHVKGRANPGRTKVTQERVEPESEDAGLDTASARRARESTIGDIQRHELTPWMRELVSNYFKRSPQSRESSSNQSN